MTDGVFQRNDSFACARAIEIMSTRAENDFEWSVKLIGDSNFYVGIASQLKQQELLLITYDENAIMYRSPVKGIQIGLKIIHSNLPTQKSGDIIRFKFQPQRKKFVMSLVRF